MLLIGMLDSPYVRRVAVSLQLLGLPFEHRALSVFRGFDEFVQINPVVKVPTLVCDDGQQLMDSTLILDYAEALAGRSLMPSPLAERQRALRVIGLAQAGCEKSVQVLYERRLRPPEQQHAPWLTRVTGQMLAAFRLLEAELARAPLALDQQAGISSAVAWHFAVQTAADLLQLGDYPHLNALSAQAEVLPAFSAAPHGESTYRG